MEILTHGIRLKSFIPSKFPAELTEVNLGHFLICSQQVMTKTL